MLTKSLINRKGKAIRKALSAGEIITSDNLSILQQYRTSYKSDVAEVFQKLADFSRKIRSDRIVSFRIKRIESILSKIQREPTMALANMGDIAGCRCILQTNDAVRKVVTAIHENFIVISENDYLSTAKSDGYSGYHLYVQSPINSDKKIEIQVRSIDCHNWATLVEIIDILFDLKIKEGQNVGDLNNFLLLMSKKNDLTIDEMKEVLQIDKNRKIYSRLNEIFLSNYIPIRKKWLKITANPHHQYFIIEVRENKESHIISFPDYNLAEQAYYEKFTKTSKSNFVLTHVDKPSFKKVSVAYSNYVLIKHQYLNDWNNIVIKVMDYHLEQSNKKEFEHYSDYVERNITDIKKQVSKEIDEVNTILEDSGNKADLFPTYGLSEWIDELRAIIDEREKFTDTIEKKRTGLPSSLWPFFKRKS